jgi:hypothetical protein
VGCIGPIVVSEVDRDHAGAASAMMKTCQQFGGALGVALVGSLYFATGGGDQPCPRWRPSRVGGGVPGHGAQPAPASFGAQ